MEHGLGESRVYNTEPEKLVFMGDGSPAPKEGRGPCENAILVCVCVCVCAYTVVKFAKLLSVIWSLVGQGKRMVY